MIHLLVYVPNLTLISIAS